MSIANNSPFLSGNEKFSDKELKNSLVNTWGYTLELTQTETSILHIAIPSYFVDLPNLPKENCNRINPFTETCSA